MRLAQRCSALTLAAIAFRLIWLHAVRGGRLVAAPMGRPAEWRSIGRFSIGTLLYAATIGISFAAPGAAVSRAGSSAS